MELKFISRIRKGNNKGTGFIYLQKDKINAFHLGDWVVSKSGPISKIFPF